MLVCDTISGYRLSVGQNPPNADLRRNASLPRDSCSVLRQTRIKGGLQAVRMYNVAKEYIQRWFKTQDVNTLRGER